MITDNNKIILPLTLNYKWFDMIIRGVKKEEYREIKPYWIKRLKAEISAKHTWTESGPIIEKEYKFKHFDLIKFTNGYNPNSPSMIVELKGIKIGFGNPEWGGIKQDVFILELGNILKTKNIK